jgi:regulation of enolase protein 1 (concanavalin A-like superfamily)
LHWHVNLEQNNEENGEMIISYQELYQSMMIMLKQDAP